MKKFTLLLILVFALSLICVGCTKDSREDTAEMDVLSIQDIQKDPLAFTGEIKISGVASAFSEEDATYFAVMDTAELLACKNLYCGAYAMPAKYSGSDPLPELADMIDITGSFVSTDTGYYFDVTKIEVKQNIMSRLTFSNPGGA